MSSLWVYQWLKWGLFYPQFTPTHSKGNGFYAADGNSVPATHTESPGRNLLTPTDKMWWIHLQNHQQKEGAWWSNGRFRMRDSCGNQNYSTTLLSFKQWNGKYMFLLCSKKTLRSAKTPRIAHVQFWKMQSNRRSRDFVWCEWTILYSQTCSHCAGSVQWTCDWNCKLLLTQYKQAFITKWIIFRQ